MAGGSQMRGMLQRILASIPRGTIVGRVVHPLVEERKTLAGRMAWIGLAMLIAFLFVAVFADLISPYNPELLVDEGGVPPLTNAVIVKNYSYSFTSLTNWTNTSMGKLDDGKLMLSANASDVVDLRSFGFRLFVDSVQRVEILVQANSTPAAPDQFGDVSVSWDGGNAWSSPWRTSRRTSDADNGTNIFDATSLTPWTRQTLDDFHFRVRLVHTTTGGPPGP